MYTVASAVDPATPAVIDSLYTDRSTQVDASNQRCFISDHHNEKKKKHVDWVSFLERLFPSGVPLFKEFLRRELEGRENLLFPLGTRFFSGSYLIPHLSPREH